MAPAKKEPLPTPDFKLPQAGPALSNKTRAIYETVWGLYVLHCKNAGVPHLPPDSQTVAAFVREKNAVYGHVRKPALTRIFQAHDMQFNVGGQAQDLTALVVDALAASKYKDYQGLVDCVGTDIEMQRAALKEIL